MKMKSSMNMNANIEHPGATELYVVIVLFNTTTTKRTSGTIYPQSEASSEIHHVFLPFLSVSSQASLSFPSTYKSIHESRPAEAQL